MYYKNNIFRRIVFSTQEWLNDYKVLIARTANTCVNGRNFVTLFYPMEQWGRTLK